MIFKISLLRSNTLKLPTFFLDFSFKVTLIGSVAQKNAEKLFVLSGFSQNFSKFSKKRFFHFFQKKVKIDNAEFEKGVFLHVGLDLTIKS